MNGIDISHHKKDIDLNRIEYDFMIAKATQGKNFRDPCFKRFCNAAIASGKLIGLYHYVDGSGSAEDEAKNFVDAVSAYVSRALLVVDWEPKQNRVWKDTIYLEKVLDLIKTLTGSTPMIYISKSFTRSQNLKAVADKYPLWVAQYANHADVHGYQDNPWTDNKGYGPWKSPSIHQYTSHGILPGYSERLDLNKAYITREQWVELVKSSAKVPKYSERSATYSLGFEVADIKKWDKGSVVVLAQKALVHEGYGLKVDGLFGDKTAATVIQFQTEHSLTADGIIGRKTWSKLLFKIGI
jgi:GH25 family lysozyme M1 (1,4-beta-N-acetylmuramidase)